MGEAGPLVAEALRQFADKAIDFVHRVARADAHARLTLDFHRRAPVVAFEARRAVGPVTVGKRRERHHASRGIADEPFVHVFRLHPEVRIALKVDRLDPAAIDEVVDVVRTPRDRQGIVDVAEGEPEGARLRLIDVDVILGLVLKAVGAGRCEKRGLPRLAQDLVARRHQGFMALVGDILEIEVKAVAVAHSRNRRRSQRIHLGILDLRKCLHRTTRDRLRGELRARAFVERPHPDEDKADVLALAGEAEACDVERTLDRVLFLVEVVIAYLFQHTDGSVPGRADRQLHRGDDDPLVFLRQERTRQTHEQHRDQHDDADEAEQEHQRPLDHPARPIGVGGAGAVEVAVEPRGGTVATLLVGLQERGAERRSEDQGDHHRKDHRGDDGDRELAVDHADRAAEERHRHEHRGQHRGDADQRAGDLVHRLDRRLARRQVLFAHHPLDILDDDDRIVHQQADGEHHREHRQGVDRIAEECEDAEGAEQHHRHRDRRDQGGAEVLQEHQHHDEYQNHRLDQGLHHFVDRETDERRGVVRIDHVDPGGEARTQAFDRGPHTVGGRDRVGPGREVDRKASRRHAVV